MGRPVDIQSALKPYFNTIFIQLFNLCYQNLEFMSLLVWKLWEFPQGSNFVNFQQFFHHNFRLKWKFSFLMVSSEISSTDLLEYILFQIFKNIFFLSISHFQVQMKNARFVVQFFFPKYFQILVILKIPMIATEKSHQNISDYNKFLLKKKI